MKITQNTTKAVIGGTVAFLLIWEVIVLLFAAKDSEATISEAFWELVDEYPYLDFFFGIVCGHLTWQTYKRRMGKVADQTTEAS